MSRNANLHNANKAKNDEFYTQIGDIANELKHYKKEFLVGGRVAVNGKPKYARILIKRN